MYCEECCGKKHGITNNRTTIPRLSLISQGIHFMHGRQKRLSQEDFGHVLNIESTMMFPGHGFELVDSDMLCYSKTIWPRVKCT